MYMAWVVPAQFPQAVDFVSQQNRSRQFDFLHMSFAVSQLEAGLEIDHEFVCLLNAYAARYLSQQPGRYRRHYDVEVGQHKPSAWAVVYEEMESFLETLHRNWTTWNAVEAAAYVLWAVNHVHPFAEGNGRTARALSYYVFCKKQGQWLPGSVTFVELIRATHRQDYCEILQRMHLARKIPKMETDLTEMVPFLGQLILEQITLHQQEQAAKQPAASSQPSAATGG
jgi:Fic family protein